MIKLLRSADLMVWTDSWREEAVAAAAGCPGGEGDDGAESAAGRGKRSGT